MEGSFFLEDLKVVIKTSIGWFSPEDFVKKCNEKYFPEGLKILGNLDLRKCTSLTTLPEGLQVGGFLFLEGCTSLTALPSDMKVGWTIYADESFIQNYPFKEIPKILHLPFTETLKQLLLERLQ
jgi:hypothetical protein